MPAEHAADDDADDTLEGGLSADEIAEGAEDLFRADTPEEQVPPPQPDAAPPEDDAGPA